MSKKTESDCDCGCDCSGKSNSTGRHIFAGAFGGVIGVAILAALAAFALRRLGPQMMPRLKERMRDCGCCSEMKGCMDRCCCDGSADADETAATD